MLFLKRNNSFTTSIKFLIVIIFIHSLCANHSIQPLATVLGATTAPQLLSLNPTTATITFSIPPATTSTPPSSPPPLSPVAANIHHNNVNNINNSNINSHIPQLSNNHPQSSSSSATAPPTPTPTPAPSTTTTIAARSTPSAPEISTFNISSSSTIRNATVTLAPATASSTTFAPQPSTISTTTPSISTTTTTTTTTPAPPVSSTATVTTTPTPFSSSDDFTAFSTFAPPELPPAHWPTSNPSSHLDLTNTDQLPQGSPPKDNIFDLTPSSTTTAPFNSQPVDLSRESADIVQPILPTTSINTPDLTTNNLSNNYTFLNHTDLDARNSNNQNADLEKRLSEERSQPQPIEFNNSMVPSPLGNLPKVQILRPNQKQKFKCNSHSDCRNGICINGTCFCSPGFTGESCDINIDECRQFGGQPCFNNGTCIDEINGFRCDCPLGFRGDRCQELADMCADSPCINGAKCINHRTHFTCNCEPGWEGQRCEIDIDDCVANPCQNNATCHDQVNSYRCECSTGFTGVNCEININDCALNPCQNNATCHDRVNDYSCECPIGFSGKNCEENIDDCMVPNICNHGDCYDLIGGFECKCLDGYTGKLCNQDVNECETNRYLCLNDGVCRNFEGGYACSCREGYTESNHLQLHPSHQHPHKLGKNCSIINDYCKAKQPCGKHGICKNINSVKNLFQCECQSGYVGSKCERKRDCSNDVCHTHHAHCINNVTCACLPGRREERIMCEYVSSCDQVDGDLCLNGGFCQNLETGGYHCNCQEPFYGPICQFAAEKPQFDAFLLVVITCVGLLIAACTVVSLVLFRSVRKARATRGTYSPSTQEKFGNSASDLLKPPVPERLI